MFIDKLPFLVTITCGIHFGMIEFLGELTGPDHWSFIDEGATPVLTPRI
jgi:hypothetical protein